MTTTMFMTAVHAGNTVASRDDTPRDREEQEHRAQNAARISRQFDGVRIMGSNDTIEKRN
jgi:hypothetical protein